jgi:transposase
MVIWDNVSGLHSVCHKSKEVKEFLNTDLGKRVWVSNIPPYSPELNPDELI